MENTQKQEAIEQRDAAPAPQQALAVGTAAEKAYAEGPKLQEPAANTLMQQATKAESLAERNLPRLVKDFTEFAEAVAKGEGAQASNWAGLVNCTRYILLQNQKAEPKAKVSNEVLAEILVRTSILSHLTKRGEKSKVKQTGVSINRLVAGAKFTDESLAGEKMQKVLNKAGVTVNGKVYTYASGGMVKALNESGWSFTRVHDAFASVYRAGITRNRKVTRSLAEAVQANADKLSVRIRTKDGIEPVAITSDQQASYVLMQHLARKFGGAWSDAQIAATTLAMQTAPEPKTEIVK